MKKMTTKATKLFITMTLMFAVCFTFLNIKVSATEAEEKKEIYKVVTGTATKLGTDEKTELKENYLELWEISEEKIEGLSNKTKDRLLKATNADKLPIEMKEVTAETLTELAKQHTPELEKVYQGYAQLNIKNETQGYVYGVTIEGSVIKGYYVSITGKTIYELNLSCEVSKWQELKGVKVTNSTTSNNEEYSNYGVENYSSKDSSSDSSDSIVPTTPTTPTTPQLPQRPGGYEEGGVGQGEIPGSNSESLPQKPGGYEEGGVGEGETTG